MITQSFSVRVLTSILFLTFSFVALAPFAQAMSIDGNCYRYSYTERYVVDTNTLPPFVTVRKEVSPDGINTSYFLYNESSKPLIVQYKGSSIQTQLKLADSKAYYKSSYDTDWFEITDTLFSEINKSSYDTGWFKKITDTSYSAISSSLYYFVDIDSVIFRSNTKPAPLAPVRFSIAAQYNGQPVNITGTLSYILLDRDCSTGKIVIADTVVTTPSAPTAAVSFVQNLSFRMRSVAVSNLQQFLVSQGLLAADLVTGYFGPKTLAAVKAFQRQQSITPVSGFFGPLTRVKANSVAIGSAGGQ